MTFINPSSTLPSLGISLSSSSGTPLSLQTGQTLSATVLSVEPDGRLRLQLAGQTVEARSLLPLIKGQQLQVLVEVESSRVMLRLLEPNSAESALAQAWRNALPRQMPLANVLQALARLVQQTVPPMSNTPSTTQSGGSTSVAPATALSPSSNTAAQVAQPAANTEKAPAATAATSAKPLPEQVKQVLERLTPLSQLSTADGLRKALLNSGLFFESRLARGDKAALSEDFKAVLLRLLGQIKAERNTTAAQTAESAQTGKGVQQPLAELVQELGQQLESAAARIKVQQLHTLATQSTTDPAWLLELPLRHNQENEVLRLRIQREAPKNDEGRGGWSVRLHFDDQKHGATDALVTLTGQRVGVKFLSERPATATLFNERFEELRSRLQQAGLEIEHLHATVGKAPTEDIPTPNGLLSIKA